MGATLKTAVRIARSIVLSDAPRPPRVALAILLVLALLVVGLEAGAFLNRVPFPQDGHASISLDEAVNARYCGRRGALSRTHDIGAALTADRRLLTRPFRELMIAQAGSVDEYCRSVDVEFLNNENSMMLLMRLGLRLLPDPTTAGLNQFLSTLRLLAILIFGYALLEAGASVLLTAVAMLTAAQTVQELRFFDYSIYSFFVPMLLLVPSVYALALRRLTGRSAIAVVIFCAGAGFLTALCVNMRSSYLPVYLALFCVFMWVVTRAAAARPWRRAMTLAAGALLFMAAYALFGALFISPLVPRDPAYVNSSYHVIAHPLVLALGEPESAFSHRQGIAWNDAAGPHLAQQMIPNAVYLGHGYEAGLFLFYVRLWMTQPAAMRGVYANKFHVAGTGMSATDGELRDDPLAKALRSVVRFTSGWQLFALYGAAAAAAAWAFLRREVILGFLVLELSLVALLLLLESAIIKSTFALQYHAYLLFWTVAIVMVSLQVLLDLTLGRLIPSEARA